MPRFITPTEAVQILLHVNADVKAFFQDYGRGLVDTRDLMDFIGG